MKKISTLFTSSRLLVLLDQALVSGGNFALGVLLARWIGMEAFGEYSLLWMGVLFALSLHQAYLTQPLMSLFAKKQGKEGAAYLHSLFVLQTLSSAGLAGLSLAAFFLLKILETNSAWLPWLPLTGLLSAAYLMQDFLRKTCFVKQLPLLPLLMDAVLYAALLTSLWFLQKAALLDLGAVLTVLLAACCFSCGLGIWRMGPGFFKNWDKNNFKQTAKEHYHFSFWLLGTSLVQWFSGNFFLIAAAGVLGTVAVGALRMAQNMVGLCHVFFLAMENVVPAEAARRFFTEDKDAMLAYLRRVGLLAGIPVGLLLAALVLLSPWLIGALYGAEYQSFSHLVGAYSALYVLVYVGFPMRFALRTMQHTSPIFIAYCLSALVSVLAAFPMARHWGMGGVMAGLIGTQALTVMVYAYFIWKDTKTPSAKFASPVINH